MEALLSLVNFVIMLVIIAAMIIRVARGEAIFSLTHFFLLGFIQFQALSAVFGLGMQNYTEAGVTDPESSGLVFTFMSLVFLAIFAIFWKTRALTFGFEKRLGRDIEPPSPAAMMAISWGILLFAGIFRFGIAYIPVISALALIIAAGLSAAAAGLGAWAWAKRWNNPIMLAAFLALLAMAVFFTMYQNFGRRDTANVLVAALFGGYQGYFRHVSLRRAIIPLTLVGSLGLLTLGAYSSGRVEAAAQLSAMQTIRNLVTANPFKGLQSLIWQDASAYSMYLIEARPEIQPYDTLHSLYYGASMPIPRQFWPEKPQALGLTVVPEIGIRYKSSGFNVGPGIIGHISNDNPYIAIWLYPIILATFLRIADDVIKRCPNNPFVVMPLGSCLAEVLAFSRGELGLFVFRAVATIISAYVVLWILEKAYSGATGRRFSTAAPEDGDATEEPSEQQGTNEYGADLVQPEYAREYMQSDDADYPDSRR